MSATTKFQLDPDAELDFAFDWSEWLAEGETISDYTLTETGTITIVSDSEDAGVVTVWVAAAAKPWPTVTCHIVTDQGRQDDRTIRFDVRER